MPHHRQAGATLYLLLLMAAAAPTIAAPAAPAPVTAILGAMPVETALLERTLTGRSERRIQGVRFVTGALYGRRVVLAESGIGKVNAAMTTTLLIDHFKPAAVLFTGIAGGINPDLAPGDLVIGQKTVQHDFGAVVPEGFRTGPTPNPFRRRDNPLYFQAPARLLTAAEGAARDVKLARLGTGIDARMPRITRGIIATGDVFVASSSRKTELRKNFQADAVEMEGAAVAQVCWQLNVPCLVIRSLSDAADDHASRDLEQFINVAARNSAMLTTEIVKRLAPAAVGAPRRGFR